MKSLAEFLGVADPLHPERPVVEAQGPPASVKVFCREILATAQYREHLLRMVIMDTIPPTLEAMLWDRGYGKLTHRVEVEDKTQTLENLTPERVREKLEQTQRMLRLLDEAQMGLTDPLTLDEPMTGDPSIH